MVLVLPCPGPGGDEEGLNGHTADFEEREGSHEEQRRVARGVSPSFGWR